MLTSDKEVYSYIIIWSILNILWLFSWIYTFIKKKIALNKKTIYHRSENAGQLLDGLMIITWCIIIISYISLKIFTFFEIL